MTRLMSTILYHCINRYARVNEYMYLDILTLIFSSTFFHWQNLVYLSLQEDKNKICTD